MPDLEYFIVCRSVTFDIDTDEISLSGILEDIYLEDDNGTVLPRAVAVSSWNLNDSDEGKDFSTVLRITLPDGTKPSDFPMNLERRSRRHRAMISITEIPLEKPGVITFEVLLNAQHGANHKVLVHPPGTRASEGIPMIGGGKTK